MTSPSPRGRVFDPSHKEIVAYYLPKLIQSKGDLRFLGNLSYVVKVCNVYSMKPSVLFDVGINILNNDNVLLHPCVKANQRFFFSNRETIAHKNSNGKRPRRTLREDAGDGYWKSSTGEIPIFDDDHHHHNQLVLGYVNMLNYYEYNNNNQKKNRKDAKKSRWIMYEYRLPGDGFQEWVVCKIKDSCRGEEDQREVFWLDRLFSSHGVQAHAGKESSILPQQMQVHEYPSFLPLTNNLVEVQAAEAVPFNIIINYGYAGLIRNGMQGGDTSINQGYYYDVFETTRFASGFDQDAELGGEFVVDDGILGYWPKTETGSLSFLQQQQQQEEGNYLTNHYEPVSNCEAVGAKQKEVEVAANLQKANGYIFNGPASEEQGNMNKVVRPSSIEKANNLQQQRAEAQAFGFLRRWRTF